LSIHVNCILICWFDSHLAGGVVWAYNMAYTGATTAGQDSDRKDMGMATGTAADTPRVLAGRKLFMKKNPGAPGKLGKTSTKAESLSKLRGKGALA
jgi:hypothetical protein